MVMPTIISEKDCGCIVYRDCTCETHIEYCKEHGGFRDPPKEKSLRFRSGMEF
jgi:hypothetical protein